MIKFLSSSDILFINKSIIEKFRGLQGLISLDLLESSVAAVINNYNYNKECDIIDLSIVYLFSLIQNHPFIDGNKRTALTSMLIFLDINNITYDIPQDELENKVIQVSTKTINRQQFKNWIKNYINK